MLVPYSNSTLVADPFGVTAALSMAVEMMMLDADEELMVGRAMLDESPVVKRDSKAPWSGTSVESVAVPSSRTVCRVLAAIFDEGVKVSTVFPALHAKLPPVLGVMENAAWVVAVFIGLLKVSVTSVAGEIEAWSWPGAIVLTTGESASDCGCATNILYDVSGTLIGGMPSKPVVTVTVSLGSSTFTSTVPAGWIVGRAAIDCADVEVLRTTKTSSLLRRRA